MARRWLWSCGWLVVPVFGAAAASACGEGELFGSGTSATAAGGQGGHDTSAGAGGAAGGGAQGGAGGVGPGGTGPGGSAGGGGAAPVTDFFQPGPYEVSSKSGQVAMLGCGFLNKMDYLLFEPEQAEGAPIVVLAHGFERGPDNMAEMAKRMASFGVRVLAPGYCHMSMIDYNPAQNAADELKLVAELGSGAPVIHAGHSAGGLVALLAAEKDSGTVAVLALDAVDKDGLGAAAALKIVRPTLGLDGEPGTCNQNNNGGVQLAKLSPQGWAARVVGATHCDFEGPTDWACTSLCGGEGSKGQRDLIRAMAAAFVAWQAGLDPSGKQWVTVAGSKYQELVSGGALAPL
ncbi:MAG: alpha/beta hydrolase [Deltaproteobacteria bacterium]|nr:alpha/beta hydrolase [Deltaproteobacteria bacterium]